MVQDEVPLGRRRHCRSADARHRRNTARRERRFRRRDLRDAVAADEHCPDMDPVKLLRFYANQATAFRLRQKDKCLGDLSDGSAKPSACHWFESDYGQDPGLISEMPLLRSRLHSAVSEVLQDSSLHQDLLRWMDLPREKQSAETATLRALASAVSGAAGKLASSWSKLLQAPATPSSTCSIKTDLLRALLLATKGPGEVEDTLICDEIARGCRIGIEQPITATGLWPKDHGPKHTGYGLSISAASSWRNYSSCDPFTQEVVATLQSEVLKGHMRVCSSPPPGSVLTKLACVVKPSGAIRLIDDLRRSGVNERVRCDETISLSGLSAAAYILSEMRRRIPRGEKLIWIESDISSAFRHIPVHVEDQKYLVNFVDAVHRVTKRLLSDDVDCGTGMIYVDDVGWVTSLPRALEVMVSILLVEESLGLNIAYEKLHITYRPHNLGYVWNLEDLTVTLPDDKRTKIMSDLSEVLASYSTSTVSSLLLDRLTGRLTWATQIAPMYGSELSPFYALQASARKHHLHRLRVGPAVAHSARVFLDLLQQPCMASTTASQLLGWVSPDTSGAVVVADASLTGLGGVVFALDGTSSGCTPASVEWFQVTYADSPLVQCLVPGDLLTSSDIGPLELLASVVGVVRALDRGYSMVTVLSDNVATVACINRRRAESPRMNETMRRLRLLWPSLGYSVISEHIEGKVNHLADFLSRSSSAERDQVLAAFGQEFDVQDLLRRLVIALS
ncbi:hypothetical protein FOZ63_006460 [Perkinsus olseni]|uniref:Reverse transcriptase domain-containing protein n=1 Tax=Perkinsus olseni TaxID=32597 RepID=A0A7J6UNQ7_PEROL|nr:hypothetical protein FOZ63_006460 [Perkinsus olseni]